MNRAWSPAAEAKLRELYPTTPVSRLAFLLKRTEKAVRSRAKLLGVTKGKRRPWSAAEDCKLRRLYAEHSAAECATQLGRTVSAVQQRVNVLGLHKQGEWIAARARQRWAEGRHEGSRRGHFRPGHVPANKGTKGVSGHHPNCRRTQFKKGRAPQEARNYVPIGTEKLDRKRGVIVRKVTDDPGIYPAGRWRPVHVIVWEAEHGPVPEGHLVRFRDGMKTFDTSQITADRLECVTLAENMRRNSYHTRYPKEVAQLIQLKGALNRKINRRSKQA